MPHIGFRSDPETYEKLLEMKGDSTWEEFFSKALGLEYEPKRVGRPPRKE